MPPKKKTDLDDLKQELDIDYHKITPEELYQRLQTHPENVSILNQYRGFQWVLILVGQFNDSLLQEMNFMCKELNSIASFLDNSNRISQ